MDTIKSFKGFDNELKCRGFQYEVGGEYEEDSASCCNRGFHACENPLDVFAYYPPAEARYCEVEQSGKIDKSGDNSKVASTKIKIGAEIGLSGIIKAGVKFTLEKVKFEEATTGDCSGALATGDCSGALATGNYSGALATGECSGASATGNYSGTSATGNYSGASATGDRSGALATGYKSGASVTGYCSGALATGDYSGASATGNCSGALATGNRSGALATGNCSGALATGSHSGASATGNCSTATVTGNYSQAAVGKGGSVAIANGYQSKAKASLGSAIVVCERGEWNGQKYPLIGIKAAIIDGEKLKADTFYKLQDGEFVEVEEDSK